MNNRSEDFGHFLFGEYENINFLFESDAHFNSTNNITGNLTLVNSFYFYEKEQLTMLWILFASIVLGNSSVLIALLLDKSRTSRFNYFIKHLAIADLSVGFVSVLTDIIWKLTIEWTAGNVACKMIRYSQAVVTYSSTYLLVALTIDRYDAIRHPMNFFKSWKRAKLLVMSAWILSMIFSIPIIVLYEEKTIQGHLQCWIEFIEPWQWQMYMIVISLTVFFIPALIIAGCYTTIIYTIWSHPNTPPNRRLKRRQMESLSEQPTEDFNKIVSSRSLIPKARVKTVKMTLIIVFVFTFCWSPYIVFDLLQVFGYVKRTQTNIAVATFIQSLAPLNSAANPIIYCLFSTYICRHLRIQKYFRSISKCCCCCASRLRKGAKITDKSTSTVLSHATSGRYLNLQHFTRLDRLSSADKKIVRGKVTSEGPPPSFIPISLAQFECIQCADDLLGVRQKIIRGEMTVSELSEKAKAFSVESLLNGRIDGDVRGKKFGGKTKADARVLTRGGITAELCCNELWEKFNRLATEMIVTKAGRRMFPTLKVRLQGLQFTANYILYMDFTLAGDTKYRYNFHRSEWTFAGPSSICDSNGIYVHPDSPALGDVWMSQLISFDKIKLTNHRKPVMLNQVSLHSMHKYQPRIHVLEMSTDCTQNVLDYIHAHSERSVTFAFEQTAFIAVTAYQNQEITKLKIESNPFAKGFRDSSNAKKEAPTGSSTHGPSSGKISNR